jgi:hypothetical protein
MWKRNALGSPLLLLALNFLDFVKMRVGLPRPGQTDEAQRLANACLWCRNMSIFSNIEVSRKEVVRKGSKAMALQE